MNLNNNISVKKDSMLGPLIDLESPTLLDPLIPLEPAFISEPILDLPDDMGDELPPVFICEYQANALESKKSLDEIKQNIEKTFNFNDISEGIEALNNPDILIIRLQQAYDSFKRQAGRPMTYSEMREMMG
jgi:hypothetical protein